MKPEAAPTRRTPRKRARPEREKPEKRLQFRRREDRFRRVFADLQDICFEVDRNGILLEISPLIERHTPFRRAELIGRPLGRLFGDDGQGDRFLHAVIQTGSLHDFELRLRSPGETPLVCAVTAALLPGADGSPPRIVCSMRDISARRLAEQELQEMRRRLSLQSRNLEELNTALKVLLQGREEDRAELQERIRFNVQNAILPCIETLRGYPLPPAQRDCVETLAARIHDIVSPFLQQVSRPDFGLTPREIQVAEGIRNGLTTKEIASRLHISTKTVDYHRDRIRRKLGLQNRGTPLRSFLAALG